MTRANPAPIVYVEANWVVACVVTHDDHHQAARKLLDQARNGECELRIPLAAVLESKHTVGTVWSRPLGQIARVRTSITKAYRNGAAPLRRIDAVLEAVLQEPGVSDYFNRPVEAERLALLNSQHVTQFSDPELEARTMETLHPMIRLNGSDLVDFYVLSAVVANRTLPSFWQRPAILFSTNAGEFEPGKKTSADFYEVRRMIFRSDFQLVPALDDWQAKFADPRS